MKKILVIILLCLSTMAIRAQHFDIDTISITGPVSQRINIVFLSDGYQTSQLDMFITDVQWMMDKLFDKPPYSRYRNYFNCFAIKVPSEVSGAADDPGSLINNYFGSTFNYAGIWRLVVPTRTDRIYRVLADNFPGYDQVFMIVNDPRYGGSGGTIATSTVHTDGPEICIHELGHSFAGLSDEYWAGQVYARENINMTQETDTSKVKWKRWLGFSSTGIFPHAEAPTWYRPHQNCEMRYLNSNFCPVCKEAIVARILDLTNPVISFTPESTQPGVFSDTLFSVSLLAPNPNTQKIWWELNRNEIAAQTDSVRLSTRSLSSGHNNLTCFILDTTSYIRNATHPSVHLHKVIWSINYQPNGVYLDVLTGKTSLSIYPNPVSESINLSCKSSLPSDTQLIVRLFDTAGKPVTRSFAFRSNGTETIFQIPLPRRQLAAGLYYLSAQTPDSKFSLPVILQ